MPVRGAQEKAAGLALLHRFRRVMLRFRNRSITIGISLAKPSGLHRGEFALRELAVTVRVGCRPVSSGFHACFRRGKLTVPIRIFRSEEHTSELQSLMRTSYAVFCLKKTKKPLTKHKISHINI